MTNLQQNQTEIWKDVPGYEGLYKASNFGKVFSYRTNREIGHISNIGYYRCTLSGKEYFVHRIIASCFLMSQYGKSEINHIDGNKLNNHVTNLEWCNRAENVRHAIRTGLSKPSGKSGVLYPERRNKKQYGAKEIVQVSRDGVDLRKYPSIAEAERSGFSASQISAVCLGKTKFHKGFFWRFA